MATSVARAAPAGGGPTNKARPVKRSHSLLVHSRPAPLAKERASSLKREQSLKEPRDHYSLHLRSPVEMFRGGQRRVKKRGGPVADSTYERPSSPLLGFRNPRRGRMVHAKSCDMTPLRLRLNSVQTEPDAESNSSDESWNVAAVDLRQENSSCQIAQLNSSPTATRRGKVWTLDRYTAHLSPSYTADSSTTTSRSQSPAYPSSLSGRPTPDIPDISLSEATPPNVSPNQASLRLQLLRGNRVSHSTSALNSSTTSQVMDRSEQVLQELIHTERRYLSNLETLLNTLLPAIEDLVAARDLRLLFPCQLEPLLDCHKGLLAQFEDRLDPKSDSYAMVGDVFQQMCSREAGNCEFFNIYSAYMNEFKVAMKTLAKYEHSSQAFRQELRSQQAECDGLPLSAFLLTPVQRLPRYELLLKDLLKHSSLDNKDNDFLEEAIDLLHEELLRLNSSIKSCELAVSVTRIRNNGRRSGSIRRLSTRGRLAGKQLARQLIKHLSAVSVEDLGGAEASATNSQMPRPISAHKKTMSVNEIRERRVMYTSAEHLPAVGEGPGEREVGVRRPMSSMERTSSCIDLATDYDKFPEKKRFSQPVWLMEKIESLPNSPEPSSPCSILPQSETEDSAAPSTSRVSICSSTSGIGSSNSQVELDSTLTLTPSRPSSPVTPQRSSSPTESSPLSLDNTPTNPTTPTHTTVAVATQPPAAATAVPHRPIIVSTTTATRGSSSAQRRWRKRISWAGAFVMPRLMGKKKASVPDLATAGKMTSKDISFPMDFRHVQHGFIAATSTPSLTPSPSS